MKKVDSKSRKPEQCNGEDKYIFAPAFPDKVDSGKEPICFHRTTLVSIY